VSTGTMARDRGIKRQRYAEFGVAEYWILDWSRQRAEIHRTVGDPARQTEIATGEFTWQPIPGGPVLTLDIAELLREF
jgi:Uma2 family endonuclease